MLAGSFGVLLMIFSTTGLWAVAGVQAFGGKIYRDELAPSSSARTSSPLSVAPLAPYGG